MVAVLAVEASSKQYELRVQGKSSRITEGPFTLRTRRSIAFHTKPGEERQSAAMPSGRNWLLHR